MIGELRRNELVVAFVMLVGGALPGVMVYLCLSRSVWGAVGAGVLFWPCAYLAGTIAEARP